jgi:hypothetical protein
MNVSPTYYSALLQHSFTFEFGGILLLFDEFYPGPVNGFQAVNTMNPGDLMFIEGVDGNADCADCVTTQPTNGCYLWEDLSQDDWVETDIEPYPTGTTWNPASAEYISEWHPRGWCERQRQLPIYFLVGVGHKRYLAR